MASQSPEAVPLAPSHAAASTTGRAVISDGAFFVDGQEVVLIGGNCVFKSAPYFPPVEIVEKIAWSMASGLSESKYVPPPNSQTGNARVAKPCVRIGCLMQGAMPQNNGVIDASWAANLDAAVKTFQKHGVFVFLDFHQDALCVTNGGDGLPWWVADEMQKTEGCCLGQCCGGCVFESTCWSCLPSCQTSLVTSPSRPLRPFLGLPNCLAKCFGIGIDTADGDDNPWLAYSPGSSAGDPAVINVGNMNMRMNNSDNNWGRLITTEQCQALTTRIYKSPFRTADRALFFDRYVTVIQHLGGVWEKYSNVVAVELFNEPLLQGLPNLCKFLGTRSSIFDFYGAVFDALAQPDLSFRAPIAVDEWSSCVPASSAFGKCLACCGPISSKVKLQLKELAGENRLILSFHYYAPPSSKSLTETCRLAASHANELGSGVPIWLSEYWDETTEETATNLKVSVEAGCNAVTYWQEAWIPFTKQLGWYKYPQDVIEAGSPVDASGTINAASWKLYEQTVAADTFFGASICGGSGAKISVLAQLGSSTSFTSQPSQSTWTASCNPFSIFADKGLTKAFKDSESEENAVARNSKLAADAEESYLNAVG